MPSSCSSDISHYRHFETSHRSNTNRPKKRQCFYRAFFSFNGQRRVVLISNSRVTRSNQEIISVVRCMVRLGRLSLPNYQLRLSHHHFYTLRVLPLSSAYTSPDRPFYPRCSLCPRILTIRSEIRQRSGLGSLLISYTRTMRLHYAVKSAPYPS